MNRGFNFSAGPSMLPEEVLNKAASEMLCYENTGQSVMEMSHRSNEYMQIVTDCEDLLRHLLKIPQNYKVLFLQGGASLQFHMVPLNLLTASKKVDVINTGTWTKKAIEEINKLGTANIIASSEDQKFNYIPTVTKDMLTSDAEYLHICQNNTVEGTAFHTLPTVGNVTIISDMSSCILSGPVNITDYGIIFAGAQKNMSCAGLTVVIIREDLIGKVNNLPAMLDYKKHADNSSLYNTPPTYAIYICKLVLEWLRDTIGGLDNMYKINLQKAGMFYDYLDNSKLFSAIVSNPNDRSIMNIPFTTGDKQLDADFIEFTKQHNLYNLKGHKLVGGLRASIYNAMPIQGITTLIDTMLQFEMR
ncbi:MAG: 3-phosphoserine/phosphohydroxythreonine transaminase [Oscillospiraceae bacterium]